MSDQDNDEEVSRSIEILSINIDEQLIGYSPLIKLAALTTVVAEVLEQEDLSDETFYESLKQARQSNNILDLLGGKKDKQA